MGSLAFFPWLSFKNEIRVAEFRLLPFQRGKSEEPSSEPLRTICRVLAPHVEGADHPVRRAVVLKLGEKPLLEELSEEEMEKCFLIADLLAFVALSERGFFGSGHYCNRDDFHFVIQRFSDPSGYVGVRSRRVDGYGAGVVSPGAYKIRRPFHVTPTVDERLINRELLGALLDTRALPSWSDYWEAIYDFNRSYSDSDQVHPRIEAVTTVGAFQRFFGITNSDVNVLADAFHEHLRPWIGKDPASCQRLTKDADLQRRYGKLSCVAEAWIRDFYLMRGSFAHGQHVPGVKTAWTLAEHRLLAAFVFPLVVKVKLSREASSGALPYKLSRADELNLAVFEALCCYRDDLFRPIPPGEAHKAKHADEEGEQEAFPWNGVRSEHASAHVREMAKRFLDGAFQGEKEKSTEGSA